MVDNSLDTSLSHSSIPQLCDHLQGLFIACSSAKHSRMDILQLTQKDNRPQFSKGLSQIDEFHPLEALIERN